MLSTPLGRFRVVAFVEGISYLILLFIAMPLKYYADMPMAVTITGGLHGGLFVAYVGTLAHVYFSDKWKFSQGFLAFVASLIPFATFFLDRKLSRSHQRA
jgi:integral membrane protein